jgi:F-type H+-transporting ATPase subunit delta
MTGMKEYANALFLLAKEDDAIEIIKEQMSEVLTVLKENPDYIKLLDTPAISKEERLKAIDTAFSSLSENLVSLLKILCEKHAVFSFDSIYNSYCALYDEHFGIEHVEAITAVAMTEEQLISLTAKLEATSGKKIVIKNTVSPEILGGVVLRYAGNQLDGSVKQRLESFEKSLKSVVI